VKCNVPKRGWINGVGGCPNVGGICIACTMPGFPDKFMPFMDEPPGARVSTGASGMYGTVIRTLRGFTTRTADKEPKWRVKSSEPLTGSTRRSTSRASGSPNATAHRRSSAATASS
jgi:hydrogenase small subunit